MDTDAIIYTYLFDIIIFNVLLFPVESAMPNIKF